ncbi:MAG: BACON domain-containing protein [Bacteroidales bacterium]|nr:BACON domain-containing protein [Candidatus Cryptobacteroides onthequi]
MKKTFRYLALATAMLTMAAACDIFPTDDPAREDEAVVPTGLQIVKSEVLFDACESTGKIELNENTNISATCEASWLTYEVSGGMVNVKADENPALEGRTAMMTITNGTDKVKVAIQQRGYVVTLVSAETRAPQKKITIGDDAANSEFILDANVPVTFTCDAAWLKVDRNDNDVTIKASANTSGHIRSTFVYYETAAVKDSIEVLQYDFDKDIAGKAYFLFRSSAAAASFSYFNCTITKDAFVLPDLGLKFPMVFKASDLSFSIFGGQLMGPYMNGATENYAYTGYRDTGKGYWGVGTNVSISGSIEYDADDEASYIMLEDNGSWSGYEVTVLSIELMFAEKAGTSATDRVGRLTSLYLPIIVERDDADNK